MEGWRLASAHKVMRIPSWTLLGPRIGAIISSIPRASECGWVWSASQVRELHFMTRSKASQCCHELLKCERKVTKGCTRGCKCVRVELPAQLCVIVVVFVILRWVNRVLNENIQVQNTSDRYKVIASLNYFNVTFLLRLQSCFEIRTGEKYVLSVDNIFWHYLLVIQIASKERILDFIRY